tara:strand:- start:15966 stop:17093 length:1128 start_codon:yes stop_codon:yes gene_type:complete
MRSKVNVNVPEASATRFTKGIVHPDLWLWDSWTCKSEGKDHLYCLAFARKDSEGRPTSPAQRNDFTFHIRHFESEDAGASWRDCGAVVQSTSEPNVTLSDNIWSGSTLRDNDGAFLFAYTGLPSVSKDRRFLQTICIAESAEAGRVPNLPLTPVSDPIRDYNSIRAAGYFIGERETLGANCGESGGPILAWRDPFLFTHEDRIHAFWAAKAGPLQPAVAHAILSRSDRGDFVVDELLPPMLLPDGNAFTQAEVPKVYFDAGNQQYWLIISACNRMSEDQSDDEIVKDQRLYVSESLRGPWIAYRGTTSVIPDIEHLFGASVIDADFAAGHLRLIAPYTEMADRSLQLTFAPVATIALPEQERVTALLGRSLADGA